MRLGCRWSRHSMTCSWTEQLTGVGEQGQSGPLGDRERAGELGRVAAPLVVRQPEAEHASTGVLRRQARERPRVERMAGAVGRHDQSHADARLLRRVANGVDHQIGEGRDAAELRCRSRTDRPGSRSTRIRRPHRRGLPQARGGVRRPRCAARIGRCHRGVGTGTTPSRRWRRALAASLRSSDAGRRMPSRSASSSSVE